MKKQHLFFGLAAALTVVVGVYAADHIDAPAVTGGTSDITDYYAFESPSNSSNMVFVANVQGLLAPGTATSDASFDSDVMIEFNIDNDGDNIEDRVIQCLFKNGKVQTYGVTTPSTTGLMSMVESGSMVEANISQYGGSVETETANGVTVFAGPRDDPFFFDLTAYTNILGGTATGFSNPGTDTFAGTNVLSVVVEVPKADLGGSGTLNTWVESKRKQ